MINVLLTSAGRRVELLRAFRAAYADLGLDGRIVAVDIDPLAPALGEADSSYIVPRVNDDAYVPALAEICRREKVRLVIPLIDPDVPVLAAGKAELEAAGAFVVVVSEDSAAVTADKWRTYAFLRALSIPTPRTWLPDQVPDATFPLVVKPRFGSASQHVYTARDAAELAFFVRYVPQPLVQELVPGPEITNDVLCDLEGETLSVVSRQRIEVRGGEVSKGKTVYDARIALACGRIAQRLRAPGPITVQCLRSANREYLFTEVNARFGGGLPLAIAAGARPAHWLLELAGGQVPDVSPGIGFEVGLYLSRFDHSHFLREGDYQRLAQRRL